MNQNQMKMRLSPHGESMIDHLKRQEKRELEERELARAYQFPIGKATPELRQEED